ncbi:HIT family protein [Tuberibacillus sp. Marseille-P3662]|uniref:HIT family protein n=1 Tax=Tuberibacillus sp. Marseille-P3662 TaxID=1965358 RepID=UPI000A1C988B|nr:HIT family protein [Tuberibacillus sp. Marseille-P3662]
MVHDPNCIFCKIINGDIPSAKVFENEDVYAFLDLSQVTKGHTLVIPKNHEANIYELQPETASKLFSVVPTIAQAVEQAFQPIGMNLLNNNGEHAGQSVFHYHIHIIPRYGKGDGFGAVWHSHEGEYSNEELQNVAATITQNL